MNAMWPDLCAALHPALDAKDEQTPASNEPPPPNIHTQSSVELGPGTDNKQPHEDRRYDGASTAARCTRLQGH
jgi:hypothetical protein